MSLPRIVITGASGFIGRHLLDAIKERFEIVAMGRRSQRKCGAPIHPNITWHQVDIGDCRPLTEIFHGIRDSGGADAVVHLAAHYDFTGDEDPEYWRTNVEGLRNVLELSRGLGLRRFVFASSLAACQFPAPGQAITESSPPDGEHIYAVTKRLGEQMLGEFSGDFPSVIVRFAALFSDWCEYAPLFMFLETWLSRAWNARLLAGKGLSAVPYMHVRDASSFLTRVLDRIDDLSPGEILSASPDGAVNHKELFEAAALSYSGRRRKPIFLPKIVCRYGLWARDVTGRLLGDRPFERPWMGRYIDAALTIDARRTRQRLGWAPRERLDILRRMPFLIENFKTDPVEWYRRNREAMKEVRLRTNLRIHQIVELHEQQIRDTFTALLVGSERQTHLPHYEAIPIEEHQWHHRLILRHLLNAIRTREKGVFRSYCRDLAERRHAQGFDVEEVCYAVASLNQACLKVLREDPESQGLEDAMHDHITMTIQFGIDEIQEVYEQLHGQPPAASAGMPG
ncbi:MAG: NAD-dependent epimerase/dehydratase family protein [Acidobacteriota bacterium]